MKKSILMLGIIFLINMESKAQQNIKYTTRYEIQSNIAIQQEKTFLNSMYSINKKDNAPAKDYNYYNRVSRNLRITGLSLLGAGVVLGVSGILVSGKNNTTDYIDYERRDRTIRTLFILSAATGIASIPFMVLAYVNKSKARVILSSQKTGFGVPQHVDKNIMGVTMSLSIGR